MFILNFGFVLFFYFIALASHHWDENSSPWIVLQIVYVMQIIKRDKKQRDSSRFHFQTIMDIGNFLSLSTKFYSVTI